MNKAAQMENSKEARKLDWTKMQGIHVEKLNKIQKQD